MIHIGDALLVIRGCDQPATIFGWAEYRRIAHESTTETPNKNM